MRCVRLQSSELDYTQARRLHADHAVDQLSLTSQRHGTTNAHLNVHSTACDAARVCTAAPLGCAAAPLRPVHVVRMAFSRSRSSSSSSASCSAGAAAAAWLAAAAGVAAEVGSGQRHRTHVADQQQARDKQRRNRWNVAFTQCLAVACNVRRCFHVVSITVSNGGTCDEVG